MYRVPPHMAGKNITYQAWVKKEQETHRQNVKTMSSHLIASGAMKPPARVAVLEANPRKQKLEAERIQAIEAENARLLQRMTKIMDQGPQFTVLHRSKVFISNAVSRKLAATKIAQRNLEFCERINKVKPYYDTKKWDEDRKATEHILKGMGMYPYHPPQPKRWQDYFEAEGEEDVHDTGVEEELDRQWVQSLASFSNRPSQINEEISRSDSFSPKSLRRPKGDSWMLPGLARPGQYSRDSSGRVSQTLSDGRMEQLSPDSPSIGSTQSAAARSGLRLQPLVKTPALEAVPRRNDAPVLNSRPSSRETVAPTAADRANLWSSDGTQGDRSRSNAGQQQLQMSLRADEPDDERQGDQRAIRDADSVEQAPALVVTEPSEAASTSPSAGGLDDASAAAVADSAADLSASASIGDEADSTAAAAAESPRCEPAQPTVSVAAAVGDTGDDAALQEAAPEGSHAAEAADRPAEQRDAGDAEADASASASTLHAADAAEISPAAVAEDRPASEREEGSASVAVSDAAAAADTSRADDAETGDAGHAAAAASVDAGHCETPTGILQDAEHQHSAAEPELGGSGIDAAAVGPAPVSADADGGPPLSADSGDGDNAAAADQSEE